MTDESRACPQCQQPVTMGATVCPSCNTSITWEELWPSWHGVPTTISGADHTWEAVPAPGVDQDFTTLELDQSLVNAHVGRPGKRWWVLLWIGGVVAWFLVSRLYDGRNPAAYWDAIWYSLAIMTIGLGAWLLAALIGRARRDGVGPAVQWLVS